MGDELIGTRVYGRDARYERWYECAICGGPTPESETRVPVFPEPHTGLRVCNRASCDDEPGADYNTIINPRLPEGDPYP